MDNQLTAIQKEWIDLAGFINNEPESWKETLKSLRNIIKK